MKGFHDLKIAPWDHEPGWTSACRICDMNLSNTPERFMESVRVRGNEMEPIRVLRGIAQTESRLLEVIPDGALVSVRS
jgi:hypothetical protein